MNSFSSTTSTSRSEKLSFILDTEVMVFGVVAIFWSDFPGKKKKSLSRSRSALCSLSRQFRKLYWHDKNIHFVLPKH